MIDLGHSRIIMRSDGILQINSSEHNYTAEEMHEINDAQAKLNNGNRSLVLVIVHPFSDIESSARQFLTDPASTRYSIAEAYVIRSLAQKLIANFHLKIHQPDVPTKFFSNREEAILWLKKQNLIEP